MSEITRYSIRSDAWVKYPDVVQLLEKLEADHAAAIAERDERIERLLVSLTSRNAEVDGLDRETEDYLVAMKRLESQLATIRTKIESLQASFADKKETQVANQEFEAACMCRDAQDCLKTLLRLLPAGDAT